MTSNLGKATNEVTRWWTAIQPKTRRTKIIAWSLVVVILIAAIIWVGSRGPAPMHDGASTHHVTLMQSNPTPVYHGPTGVNVHPQIRYAFPFPPYIHIDVIFQIGTVWYWDQVFNHWKDVWVGIPAVIAAGMCAPGGPIVAGVCGLLGIAEGDYIINQFDSAARQYRCVDISFNMIFGVSRAFSANVRPFGGLPSDPHGWCKKPDPKKWPTGKPPPSPVPV